MQTLDDMLASKLITTEQHAEIRAWIRQARTPEATMRMPANLWRALELASVLMGFHSDLAQAPLMGMDP